MVPLLRVLGLPPAGRGSLGVMLRWLGPRTHHASVSLCEPGASPLNFFTSSLSFKKKKKTATVMNTGAVMECIPDKFSSSYRYVFAESKRWKRHIFQLRAEPRVGAPGKRGIGFDHPRPRKCVNRCLRGPHDRTSRYETGAQLEQRTAAVKMWDVVMSRVPIVSVRGLTIRCKKRFSKKSTRASVPVELMMVSSILDSESGCAIKRTIVKGTGSFPVSIVLPRRGVV